MYKYSSPSERIDVPDGDVALGSRGVGEAGEMECGTTAVGQPQYLGPPTHGIDGRHGGCVDIHPARKYRIQQAGVIEDIPVHHA